MSDEISLSRLMERDEAVKGAYFDTDVASLLQYYDDDSRQLTRNHLENMRLGIKDNMYPVEVNLLRRIVERVAVVYQNPPTRRLQRGFRIRDLFTFWRSGARLVPENDFEHFLAMELLDRSQYDLAMRRGDRLNALVGQHVKRFYPNPNKKAVTISIFTPNDVLRDPHPSGPDQIELDRRFALKLFGGVWEYWEKTADGWRMLHLTNKGEPLPDIDQPLAQFEGEDGEGVNLNPNFLLKQGNELPVQLCFDDWPGGRAWIPPKRSRLSWIKTLNAQLNDLWALIMHQAHQTKVYTKDQPHHKFPEQSGPNQTVELNRGDEYTEFTPSPMVAEVMSAIEEEIRLWLLSEDLPVTEFDKSKQVVTGATLKVQERPLLNRQEAQIPIAVAAEKDAWRKYRSLHNAFAATWGVPTLAVDTEMVTSIAPLQIPVDQREQGEILMGRIAAGWDSTIDAIQATHNLPREKAIEHYNRVQKDAKDFPIPSFEMEDEDPQEFVAKNMTSPLPIATGLS